MNITINPEVRWNYVLVVYLLAIIIGIILGTFIHQKYIENYTEKCVEKYNECKDLYNGMLYTGDTPRLPEWTMDNISNYTGVGTDAET